MLRSCKREEFTDLSLSVSAPTLLGCLEHFAAVEALAEPLECAACGQRRGGEKALALDALPASLLLHLKRFEAGLQHKVRAPCACPARPQRCRRWART